MSALGHKRTFAVQNGVSALPPKADTTADKGSAVPRGGSTNPSGNVAVRQADKNQHCKDHCGDAERGLLAVPFLRLPHCEVFASDDHEAEKPEGKADSQSGYGPDFGAVEDLGRRPRVVQATSPRPAPAEGLSIPPWR